MVWGCGRRSRAPADRRSGSSLLPGLLLLHVGAGAIVGPVLLHHSV
jgi:hypothetical protein